MALRIALITSAFILSTATAADWPSFRGPNGDGICTETNLLKEWPTEGPKQVWTAKNLGLGWGYSFVRGRRYLRYRSA